MIDPKRASRDGKGSPDSNSRSKNHSRDHDSEPTNGHRIGVLEDIVSVDEGDLDDAPGPGAIVDRGRSRGQYRSNSYSGLVETVQYARERD